MGIKFFQFEETIEGHTLTIWVDKHNNVVLYVDGAVWKIHTDTNTKLKIALAARRLWKSALKSLPAGIYFCFPLGESRRKVYLGAGWRPSAINPKELMYYHKIPPLPKRWMEWQPTK